MDILDPTEICLPFSNGVYLSNTLVRTRKSDQALGFSYFIPDCRERYARSWNSMPKSDKPSVGFFRVAVPMKTIRGKTKFFDYLRLALTCAPSVGLDPGEMARRVGVMFHTLATARCSSFPTNAYGNTAW